MRDKLKYIFIVVILILPQLSIADWGDNRNAEEIRRLEAEKSRLLIDEGNLRRDLQNIDRELEGARRNQDIATRELDTATRDLQQTQREVSSLSQQVSRLEQEIVRERQRKEQDIRNAQNTIAQIRATIGQIESNLQVLQRELQSLASQRQLGRIGDLQRQNQTDTQEKANKEVRVKQIDAEIRNLQNCGSDACFARRMAFEKEKRIVEEEIAKLNKAIAVRSDEIKKLQQIETQYAQKERDVQVAKNNLATQQRELTAAESRLREAQNRVILQEQELSRKQAELRAAQSRIASLEDRQRRAYNDSERYRRETQIIADRYDQVHRNWERVDADIRSIERRIAELQNQYPIERVVIIGKGLSPVLQRDLSSSVVVDVESYSTDRDAVLNSVNSILYVFADSLVQGLPQDAEAAILEAISRGATVVVVGNSGKLLLSATSEFKRLLGVEAKFSISVSRVSGRSVLSGLDVSTATRAVELLPVNSGISVEKILVSGTNEVIGTSTVSARARTLSLGFEQSQLQLRILGDIERQLCRNLRSSAEYSFRRFCQ